MSGKVDWKQKYLELRSRHMNAIDIGFRLGFQEGLKAGELQNLQMQLQQAQQEAAMAAEQAAMGGMPPEPGMEGELPPEEMAMEGGMPPEEMAMEGEVPPEEMAMEGAPAGEMEAGMSDELGASIDELESYVTKNEKDINFSELMKSFHKPKSSKKEAEESTKAHKKINDMIKKWDEEDSAEQNTENGNILGQS